jgi:hypothetical protein
VTKITPTNRFYLSNTINKANLHIQIVEILKKRITIRKAQLIPITPNISRPKNITYVTNITSHTYDVHSANLYD